MLEIIANGEVLEISKDIQINFIEENPLFIIDTIPAPYSLTFEVPATPGNLKIFGFSNRITSNNIKKLLNAEIRHSGLILLSGQLILLETTDTIINLQFKGSRIPESIKKDLNKVEMDQHEYGSFPYNYEDLDYLSTQLEDYVREMIFAAKNGLQYVIAPVRIKGALWEGNENRSGMINSVKMYLNFWNPFYQSFQFKETERTAHSPILPFPYVHEVLTSALGNYLENNPFATNSELRKLVLVSMNHENYSFDNLFFWFFDDSGFETKVVEGIIPLIDSYTSSNGNIPIKWNLESFNQAYPVIELLKNLMKIFGMKAYPGLKLNVEYVNDIMARSVSENWDNKLTGRPTIYFEPGKKYIFKYSSTINSDDKALSNYPSINEIFESAIADSTGQAHVYADEKTNALYSITRTLRGLDSFPTLNCEIKKSALSTSEITVQDKYEVISEVQPADMSIEQLWIADKTFDTADIIKKFHWYVPVIERKARNEAPFIMLYSGMSDLFGSDLSGSQYPQLLNDNVDQFGNTRHNISLLPDGPSGLIAKFHNRMKEWVEKDKIRVKGSFKLSLLEIKRLNLRDKIHLQGKIFYIYKLNYTLTHDSISLVDADLIES